CWRSLATLSWAPSSPSDCPAARPARRAGPARGGLRMIEFKSPALKHATGMRLTAPRPVKPTGNLPFTLSVTDLERTRRFYEEVVGATFWRRNDATVFMRCGEQYFPLS